MLCARIAAVVVLLPYSCEFYLLEVALTLKVEGNQEFRVKSFNFLHLLLRRTLHSRRCTAQWDNIASVLTQHISPLLPRRVVRPLNPLTALFAFCFYLSFPPYVTPWTCCQPGKLNCVESLIHPTNNNFTALSGGRTFQ
jgi:hypothetical protein